MFFDRWMFFFFWCASAPALFWCVIMVLRCFNHAWSLTLQLKVIACGCPLGSCLIGLENYSCLVALLINGTYCHKLLIFLCLLFLLSWPLFCLTSLAHLGVRFGPNPRISCYYIVFVLSLNTWLCEFSPILDIRWVWELLTVMHVWTLINEMKFINWIFFNWS